MDSSCSRVESRAESGSESEKKRGTTHEVRRRRDHRIHQERYGTHTSRPPLVGGRHMALKQRKTIKGWVDNEDQHAGQHCQRQATISMTTTGHLLLDTIPIYATTKYKHRILNSESHTSITTTTTNSTPLADENNLENTKFIDATQFTATTCRNTRDELRTNTTNLYHATLTTVLCVSRSTGVQPMILCFSLAFSP